MPRYTARLSAIELAASAAGIHSWVPWPLGDGVVSTSR